MLTRVLIEIPAALSYLHNWFAIATEQSYFDWLARPSFLQHLWSLAIEEHFYLVWPVAVLFAVKTIGRKGAVLLVIAAVAGSSLLMASLFVPFADPSRLYYGTDTRAAGILVGAALASVWSPHRAQRAPHAGSARAGWTSQGPSASGYLRSA